MQFVSYVIAFLLTFLLGYMVYPSLFIPGEEKKISHIQNFTLTGDKGKINMEVDIRKVKSHEIPETVVLLSPLLTKSSDGTTLEIQKRKRVTVLSYENEVLTVSDSTGQFHGSLPWHETNLAQEVGGIRMNKILNSGKSTPPPTRPTPSASAITEEPVAMVEEKEEIMEPAEEVEPVVEEPEEVELVLIPEEELLEVMKDSVKNKMVSEFAVDTVKKWEAGEKEEINGVEYQVGFATYEKETIFGPQPVSGKCLVRNGKVIKWIYAKTGAEIP